MLKKELSIKIDYLSIVFETLKADELIRRLLGLPLEYFMIQKAKVKHKDYTNVNHSHSKRRESENRFPSFHS